MLKQSGSNNKKEHFFYDFSVCLTNLLLLSTLLFSISANANQSNSLPLESSSSAIGEYIAVLEETAQPMSLAQARQAYLDGQFSSWEKPVLSFGIGASPRWLVTQVDNQSTLNITRRMVFENSWLDKADVYILHNNQLVSQLHVGDTLAFLERPVKHRFFAFDHEYQPGISQLFIRIETPDPMILPIFFGTQEESAERDVFNGYSYGLLYGIVIALLLYNFILFIQLRLTRYLFYVIYLTMFLAMNLSYTGHSFFLFWPDNAYWQNWMLPILISLYSISGIIFAFSFLQTRKYFPRIFYSALAVCILFLFSQWLYFIYELQTIAVGSAIGFVFCFSLFILILAIFSLKHRPREVAYFLIATIASLTGASFTAMTVWAFIPYNELSYRAVEIGLSIDVILLSIALAEQFRMLQKEKQLAEQLARLDPLTGLYNRRAFHELIIPILHNAKRYKQLLSVIILDIDNFKSINDTYGHNIGDKVIKKTADIVQKTIRKADISARWGGEEFTMLLPRTGVQQAIQLAERLREQITQQELPTNSGPFSFTVSLGVAEMTTEINSIEELIKAADKQLYTAKKNGRNKVC